MITNDNEPQHMTPIEAKEIRGFTVKTYFTSIAMAIGVTSAVVAFNLSTKGGIDSAKESAESSKVMIREMQDQMSKDRDERNKRIEKLEDLSTERAMKDQAFQIQLNTLEIRVANLERKK